MTSALHPSRWRGAFAVCCLLALLAGPAPGQPAAGAPPHALEDWSVAGYHRAYAPLERPAREARLTALLEGAATPPAALALALAHVGYVTRSDIDAARRWLDSLRPRLDAVDSPALRSWALRAEVNCLILGGQPAAALPLGERAVALARALGDVLLEVRAELALSRVELTLTRSEEAIARCLRVVDLLRARPEHGEELASAYGYAGTVLREVGDLPRGVEFMERARDLFAGLPPDPTRQRQEVANLSNLAAAYRKQERPGEAIELYREVIRRAESLGDRLSLAIAHGNLGNVLGDMERYGEATAAYQEALRLSREIDDTYGVGFAYNKLSDMAERQGDLTVAVTYSTDALAIFEGIGNLIEIAEALDNLALLSAKLGRFEEADAYHERRGEIEDQRNRETRTRLQEELAAKFETAAKEREVARLGTENALSAAKVSLQRMELEQQQAQNLVLFGGLAAFAGLTAVLALSVRAQRRAHRRLREAAAIIDEKNQQIVASLEYAERLQSAFLPRDEELAQVFAEHCALFRPRDAVSGDFYWMAREPGPEGAVTVVLADCTGHGVPGALMAILGQSLLQSAAGRPALRSPAALLEELDRGVRTALRQEADEALSRDRMEGACVRWEPAAGTLRFAGARRPLLWAGPEGVRQVAGDRRGIGGHRRRQAAPFTEHLLVVGPGQTVVLASDGLEDQDGPPTAGGPRKFGRAALAAWLAAAPGQTLAEHAARLAAAFDDFRGSLPQRDDVAVLALRLGPPRDGLAVPVTIG